MKKTQLNSIKPSLNKGGRPKGTKNKLRPLFQDLSKKGFDIGAEFIKLYQEANVEGKIDLFKTALRYIHAVPAPLYQKVENTQNNLTIENHPTNQPQLIEAKPANSIPAPQRLKELMEIAKRR